jgi:small subunit ribosomal protein S3
LSAALTVQAIAQDIEKRIPFRRSMRQAMNRLIKAGAEGAKIEIAGRLNGAEIARSERMSHGTIPLHTLRAEVDYYRGVANTTYGVIGIKAWVYRTGNEKSTEAPRERRRPMRRREPAK